jgi:protein-L-isoaspartate(D-aspartate) O-methyltransferase
VSSSISPRNHQGIGMTSQRTRERLVARLRERGISDERVLDVIRNTPRHLFVEEALAHQAYDDTALPIGHGQTISQPWVVARMTELLLALRDSLGKTLEIGTGCGYQTAVLAPLAGSVHSVERIEPLLRQARTRLAELRLTNVKVKYADGALGWPDEAPFDSILAACARPDIPRELLAQLVDGGRLIMPVSTAGGEQWLTLVERNGDGFTETRMEAVRFVPFMRGTQ